MPLSVAAPVPVGVMPYSLAMAFSHSNEWQCEENFYPSGERQVKAWTTDSRRRFHQTKRLTATELGDLRAWYNSHKGAQIPFYFYDLYETSPIFTWDPTGASTNGLYIVRFDGKFEQSLQLGRNAAQISLIEVG